MLSMQIIAEAFRLWLLEEGCAAEYLSLQQLFALCHAGLLSRRKFRSPGTTHGYDFRRETTEDPPGTASPLGGMLVRLLNGCFAAAAALPEPALRRIAASNIIAAFCRSALREARMRGRCDVQAPEAIGSFPSDSLNAWDGLHTGGCGCSCNSDEGLRSNGLAGAGSSVLRLREQDGVAPGCNGVPSIQSSIGILDVAFLDAAFSVLLVAVPRHPLLVSELQVMEVVWSALGGPFAPNGKVESVHPTEETVAAVSPTRATQAGAGAPLRRRQSSEPSGSSEVAGASGRSSVWQGSVDNIFKPAARAADQRPWDATTDAASPPGIPDAKGLAEFFFSPDFQCLLAVGQLLYGTPHAELESSCGGDWQGDAGLLRVTKPHDPLAWDIDFVPVQPAHVHLGAPREEKGKGRGDVAWQSTTGWGHQEGERVDSRRGKTHEAAGNSEGEEPGQSHQEAKWQLLVEELCEAPTLAQLCGAAAVMDIWSDLMVCAAERGEEAAARWLGRMAEVGAEGRPAPNGGNSNTIADTFACRTCGLGVDGMNVGGEMGPWGLRCGVEDTNADASVAHRATSQRCCKLLAAALRRQPETLLSSLPPQLLCVLAVRSSEVRHALLTGIATTLIPQPASTPVSRPGGEAMVTDPWVSDSQPCVQMEQHQQVVSRLLEWFRVVGWDLGEMK
ncbi:hypothetical protein VaNZ11_003913 [Volvox africanus]|uniref:Uncharacterized protein n=1 Tax=Volvox africanus TaxID=51714 RepID=A0ABQ5RVS0_9CHLO|nr:hypothetical protein VaNZ11_003913 [Volvox africanus]